MRIFDSHAHYDDGRFEAEFEGGYHEAIELSLRAGVCGIVNAGSSLRTTLSSVRLAEEYSFVYATAGIHPNDSQYVSLRELDSQLRQIEALAAHDKVKAIGEIGLDYHYDDTDKERQFYAFGAQLEIAARTGLPVVIHSRDAFADTLDFIFSNPGIKGVLHSYSGSAEDVPRIAKAGWYFSFSGPVTYKNAVRPKLAAAAVPADRILAETDAPYLPPVPHRGEINCSAFLPHTLASIGEARGISTEEAAEITLRNAIEFYRIDPNTLYNA